MRMRTDLAVSIGTGGVSAALGLLVVPIYVRLLGVEAYGLVGFLALLQGLLTILDLGLMPTAMRSVAHHRALDDPESARRLIAALASWYALVGGMIGLIIVGGSGWIATHWLDPRNLPAGTVTTSVALIGVILALRWPTGIYAGALIGCQRLTLVSLVNLAITVATASGGIALLVLVQPRVELLFFWQALVAAAALVIQRLLARRHLGRARSKLRLIEPLRSVWRFSLGMAGITLVAMLITQLDKVVISSMLSLEAFGAYSLAVVLGRSLYTLINPIYNVIQPRFTALAAMGDVGELSRAYRQWSTIFAGLFLPASLAVVLGAAPLLQLWLGDPALAARSAPLVALIAVGAAFHSVMYFPFALQVAMGDARTPLITNLILLVFYVPALLLLVMKLGALGAALASALLFATYLILGTWLAHRRLLPEIGRAWLGIDIGIPIAITVVIGIASALFSERLSAWPLLQLTVAALTAATACVACGIVTLRRFPSLMIGMRGTLMQNRQAI